MPESFERVREIAPTTEGVHIYRRMEQRLAELGVGSISVRTTNGDLLGDIDLGGDVHAELLVFEDGVSRTSGGMLYVPIFLRYPDSLDNRGEV